MGDITFRTDSSAELVDHMGNDERVVRAARVSTGYDDEAASWDKQGKLIQYLMKNRHGSPFEKGVFEFRVECPIFVAREFMRHRVASYNETSARYRKLDAVFWVPDASRPLVQAGKPGHYVMETGTPEQHKIACALLQETAKVSYRNYLAMIEHGIAREVARASLPVGIYTSFYVTINARSLMNFLSLRVDDETAAYPSKPQQEIHEVALQMEYYFGNMMPLTYREFLKNGRVAP